MELEWIYREGISKHIFSYFEFACKHFHLFAPDFLKIISAVPIAEVQEKYF